jgi:hypothetical protein
MIVKGIEGKTNAQLRFEISQGAKFIYFEYSLALVWSAQKYSRTFYVQPSKSRYLVGILYSLISIIFGWWSFRGLFYTVTSLVTNFKGGKDITSQVLKLLDNGEPSHLNNGYVAFIHPVKNTWLDNNINLTKNAFKFGFFK